MNRRQWLASAGAAAGGVEQELAVFRIRLVGAEGIRRELVDGKRPGRTECRHGKAEGSGKPGAGAEE